MNTLLCGCKRSGNKEGLTISDISPLVTFDQSKEESEVYFLSKLCLCLSLNPSTADPLRSWQNGKKCSV